MSTFLLSLSVFFAVLLIMWLVYWVWFQFFDPNNKSKNQRLKEIQSTIQWGGQAPSSLRTNLEEHALEAWLRSRSRTFEKLVNLVQQSRTSFSAGSVLGLMLALFTVVLLAGLLNKTNILFLLVFAVAIASTPLFWLSRKATKLRMAFDAKLPEALDYISRSLRAGHSLSSAMGMIGKEFPDPLGGEFKTVFDEMNFGIPFKEAFAKLSERVQSNDLSFFVIALMIQHETGGNLAELLDGLAATIRERFKLRGKVRTLSSEGRISALVLGSMPFVFGAIISLINPKYILVLFTTPQGHILLYIAGGLMVFGMYVLNMMVKIKV
ncbi:type II secretion system F family protein [Chlorobaculum sp. MV4-Y]|uniref:type II secretion system F family protein n=1 Tax=Chlorobaculum sp. MV4-Y TaxID=2976335 RepID=UPI0021AFA82D|nr:type II secretion system F family protein [Chlorobaculum sp. MV4-Y]UWX58715.1 type II secretion system F family protein [Chlorobaculum sp. MV4-Y]